MLTSGHDAYLLGQAADAVKNEMACRLDDFMRRRTGMGTLGDPSRPVVEKICRRMDATREREEIEAYYRSFEIRP
jgi:glycerol-3-phosphate dehydrogenase